MNELMLHISQTNLVSPHYSYYVDLYETVCALIVFIAGVFIGSCKDSVNYSISDWLFYFGWVTWHKRKSLPGYARRMILLVSYRWYRALARGYRWGFGQACVEAYNHSQKIGLNEA